MLSEHSQTDKSQLKPSGITETTKEQVTKWLFQNPFSSSSIFQVTGDNWYRIYTKPAFGMRAIDLFHWKPHFGIRIRVRYNELAHLVVYPAPTLVVAVNLILLSLIQTALSRCLLAVWSGELKTYRLYLPAMGVLKIANTPPQPLWKSSEVNPKWKGIYISWKRELYCPIYFKPPYLMKYATTLNLQKERYNVKLQTKAENITSAI